MYLFLFNINCNLNKIDKKKFFTSLKLKLRQLKKKMIMIKIISNYLKTPYFHSFIT